MDEPVKARGVRHHYTEEQLREFRVISAADKLQWLEETRELLHEALTPARLEAMQRFRRGEL